MRMAAAIAVTGMVATACGGGSGGQTKTSTSGGVTTHTGSVAVNPLFVSTDANGKSTGGTNPVTVRINTSSDKKLRVGFTEDEVAGTGNQWRAAGWGAVTVATLLTGAELSNREVDFDVTGKIDGPSAGGLMTVATLSLMRGDKIKPDITMTGTINPDGTIGPVGGIPYKVDGVIAAHKRRMLIPLGQRNSKDDSGNLVDVVDEGRRKGIEVTEVKDVYEAYKLFTGSDLSRPAPANDVSLDNAAYNKLKAKTETWLARFQASVGDFNSLDPSMQQNLQSIAADANKAQQQAKKLTNEGLQAGAFQKAVEAAALGNAAVQTGQALQLYLTQGADAFLSKVRGSQATTQKLKGLFDEFKTFQPGGVSDASALVAAYGDVIDAQSLVLFGEQQFNAKAANNDEALQQFTVGALYYEFAATLADAARDVLDVGRGLGGAKLGAKVDLASVSDFFRRAGEANLNAFETVVIEPEANNANVSVSAAKVSFSGKDIEYALATTGLQVMSALPTYFGDAVPSEYAQLGGAVALYNRSAGLLAKYYSLGDIDPKTLEVKGISNDPAYSAAVDLAQRQLAANVGVLRSKQVNPTVAVADNQIGGIQREGDASQKLDALSSYWDGYLNSRVLAYLGGFPTAGLQ
jgi:hypothetical protein